MKTIIISLLLLAVSVFGGVPENVDEFTLSNGIQVITRTLDNNEVEGLSFFMIGGSRALTEETQGLERFALECAVMGSDEYTGPIWRELMDRSQAEWTGNFNYDFSRYHLRCIREDMPELLLAFGDCLLNPELDEQAVEQVRMSTIQSIQEKVNSPDDWIWYVANDVFMPGHTYRKLPDGTIETVSSFTEDDIREMLTGRIRADNLLITHAGPTPPEELREILETAFGNIPEGGEEFRPVDDFTVSSDTIAVQYSETPTAYCVVKFNAPPQGHPDLPAYNAALSVVSKVLWQVLRTDNALTYATWSGSTNYEKNWGYLYVSSPEPAEACSLMADVLQNAIHDGFDPVIVTETVETNRTYEAMGLANKGTQCWILGSYEIGTGDWRNGYEVYDIMPELTPEELSQALSNWVNFGAWGMIADSTVVPAEELQPWPLR